MSKSKRKKSSKILLFLVCVVIVLGALYTGVRFAYPRKYQDLVEKYAELYQVNPSLIFATIKVESDFNPDALSHLEARGLMQITDDTFQWLKTKIDDPGEDDDVLDPETNIKYGVFFLSYLQGEFGKESALEVSAAYHAGVNNVKKWLTDDDYSLDKKNLHTIPISETSYYVKKITNTTTLYRELYKIK